MTACIVGWSHGKFGKLDGETSESLIVKAASEAIAHAGIEPRDVDVIYVGNMNGGFVRQEFHSSLPLQTHPDLRFKPSTRVENACATGSAAIHMGLNTLAAGKARFVLVVGVEKMTELNSAQAGEVLIKASYVAEEATIEAGFAGIFGKITSAYFQRYGDKSDALAKIAVKAHRNGAKNPYAHFQKEFAYEFCRTPSDKNPFVAGPLKRTDCSLVSDGAAAIVLADMSTALSMRRAVAFRANEHVQDFLPMSKRDILLFEGCSTAWGRALDKARLTLDDLSFVETHDCFTIAELLEYEAMGLTAPGQGSRAVLEGWTAKDGRLPVNRSGGLKAKGHPIGATGARIMVTLIGALRKRGLKRGVASLCIGGGEATAIAIEIL